MSWDNIEQLKICLDLLEAIINIGKCQYILEVKYTKFQKVPATDITLNKNKCSEQSLKQLIINCYFSRVYIWMMVIKRPSLFYSVLLFNFKQSVEWQISSFTVGCLHTGDLMCYCLFAYFLLHNHIYSKQLIRVS